MFDIDKATLCVKKMKNYFSQHANTAMVEIPDEIENGSNNYLIYVFYSCLLDYGMRSKLYHTNLIKTYTKYPTIFNPYCIVNSYSNNKAELLDIIKENIHPRYPNIALKKWFILSEFLNKEYPNEELKEKINSMQSYKELYNFIVSIKGYGQKTGGLLLRLIYESGICNFNDELEDMPIDRHDIEISYLNGIVNKDKLSNKELKMLGTIWIKAAKNNMITACDIDKYLWHIGNNLCSKKQCLDCPLKEECKTKL